MVVDTPIDCLPGELVLQFTQPDPPTAEPIETGFREVERGFREHRDSLACIQETVNLIITDGLTGGVGAPPGVRARKNSGVAGGVQPQINLLEGAGIALTVVEDLGTGEYDITITNTGTAGEANTASNLGAGQGWFASKVGVDLRFKSLLVAGGPLSTGSTANDVTVTISVSPAASPTVVGTGRTISTTGPYLTGGGDLSANRTFAVTVSGGGTAVVGTGRTLTATIPIRIDGGASADLSANRTLSFDGRHVDVFFPQRDTFLFDDFIQGVGNWGQMSWDNFAYDPGGSGLSLGPSYASAWAEHPGILGLIAGLSGEVPLGGELASVYLGTFQIEGSTVPASGRNQNWIVEIDVLLESLGVPGSVEPLARFGFGDSTTGDHTDGIYFEASLATNPNWRICTASGGTRTKTNTGTAINAFNWYRLRFVVNPAFTSVEFFINGSSVGTHATNLPLGALFSPFLQLGVEVSIPDSLASNNVAFVDYYYQYKSGLAR
jgi:hypothetical protein